MRLTKDNIEEWKAQLTKAMYEKHQIKDYGNTLGNDEWLKDYEGSTIQDAIVIEEEAFDEVEK